MEEHNSAAAVGTLVRARREELGLSMQELGDRVGSGRSSIHRIESAGEVTPRPDKLARVLIALDLSMEAAAPVLPDDQWGRSVLQWMERYRNVAESGAASVERGVDLIGVAPNGGVVMVQIRGEVDEDRLASALKQCGLTVTRPV